MHTSDQQRLNGAIANAGRIARNIIPDLEGLPLYIVQPAAGSMMTREMLHGCKGLYFSGGDQALRPQLEREGRWQGPGVCIVVDALICLAMGYSDEEGFRIVLGVVLHELAHWADMAERTAPPETAYTDLLTSFDTYVERSAKPQQFSPAFLAHGESFIRLCAHLWWRVNTCKRGGEVLRPYYLHFGNTYEGLEMLDAPAAYIEALGDELETYEELSLRRIATTEPPPAFTDLWNATLCRMFVASEAAA